MLTQCPNCKSAIVIPEPGIHTCQRCNARIWISKPDDDEIDKVIISPEAIEEGQKKQPRDNNLHKIHQTFKQTEKGELIAPWEEREKIGVINSMIATWKMATLFPSAFFTLLKTDRPAKGVVTYGWIFLTLGYLFWALYRVFFMSAFDPSGGTQTIPHGMDEAQMQFMLVAVIIAAPLLSLGTIYINAVLYHYILKVMGGNSAGFSGTLRVVVYASSPVLFSVLPVFGDMIGMIWSMAITVIGISKVHEISNGKAILVFMLPPIAFYAIILFVSRLAVAFELPVSSIIGQ